MILPIADAMTYDEVQVTEGCEYYMNDTIMMETDRNIPSSTLETVGQNFFSNSHGVGYAAV